MSLLGHPVQTTESLDPMVGMNCQVTWVEPNRHWRVWITEAFLTPQGDWVSRDRLHRTYGLGECPTAYQAMMAACSEWHNHG